MIYPKPYAIYLRGTTSLGFRMYRVEAWSSSCSGMWVLSSDTRQNHEGGLGFREVPTANAIIFVLRRYFRCFS